MFHNTEGMEGVELIKLKAASTYRMHPVSLLKETFRKHYLIRAKAACPSSKRTSLILSATPAMPFLR